MKRTHKKPKLALGAFLKQNQRPVQERAALVGSLLGSADPTDSGSQVASGALQGAAAGATFGPIGLAGGAIIGGVEGLLGSEAAQREKKRLDQAKETMISQKLLGNAGNSYVKGGKLNNLSSKLGVIQGGNLNAISPDAVEVQANNPNKTDSVELDNAFVDHGEVIDRENRVFSKELGFAKLAKKLEKQKNVNPRFSTANEHIESKLDHLFREQESMKKKIGVGGNYYENGGTLEGPDKPLISKITNKPYKNPIKYTREQFNTNTIPSEENYVLGHFKRNPKLMSVTSGTTIDEHNQEWPGQVVDDEAGGPTVKFMDLKGNTVSHDDMGRTITGLSKGGRMRLTTAFPMKLLKDKTGFAAGGLGDFDVPTPKSVKASIAKITGGLDTPEMRMSSKVKPIGFAQPTVKGSPSGSIQDIPSTASPISPKNPFDFSKAITSASTFAPNLVSQIAQNRLKGPATQQLESRVRLNRINPDAQIASADLGANKANQIIRGNTAQAGDIASATGSILAQKLANRNQIYGAVNNQNAQVQAQEANMNIGIGARNTERFNEFNQASNDFSNLKQKLTTENVSNLSNKFQQKGREKNQMQLDRDKAMYSSYAFRDSGVHGRTMDQIAEQDPEAHARLKQLGYKHGGKMKIPKETRRMEDMIDPEIASKGDFKSGGTIHIKKSHRGLLHKNLHIPQGQKIPKSKLVIHEGDSPALKKRKIFAQNFGHKK